MRNHTVPSLFDRFFDEALSPAPVARPFRPALDLIEYPDRYEVVADLPGVDQKEVEVEFIEGVLHVRGERAGDTLSDEARAFRRERTPRIRSTPNPASTAARVGVAIFLTSWARSHNALLFWPMRSRAQTSSSAYLARISLAQRC